MCFLPDVFVIGAMKAGTTTLYNHILQHPSICLTRTKEVNYFIHDYSFERFNRLYKTHFASPELLKIDVSPAYSKRHIYPGVAERIYRANPNARIIFIARDPYERLISHLQHNLLRDRFNSRDLEKEVLENDDYIKTSSYYYQLEDYIRLFGKDKILLLVFEDMRDNLGHFLNLLSEFLGISNLNLPGKNIYASDSRYKIKYYDPVHRLLGESLVTKAYHYFWYFVNIKVGKPVLNRELKAEVISRLKLDFQKLQSVFDFNYRQWKSLSD
jgi:hypothetical protein